MSDKKNSANKKEMIKNYEIIDVVGKGGMGEVYLAKHPTLKREIILKKLKIRDKEATERFLQEAKVMLDFRHENIVQFYDHFKEAGSTYIAMEYVKGKALNKIIEENEMIPVPIALFILYQIAIGLHHAHTKKVVHRDIKPHNILISREGEVKLTDFGIAMRTSEQDEITKTGTIVGTPAYMAPEQFSSKKPVTYQTDIYSLGVVFYEMITGVRPFKNEFSNELMTAISKGKYPSPKRYVKKIPHIATSILARTFNPNSSRRYKSLVPLIKRLRHFFKKYNLFEIRDSIKKLVLTDKKLLKSDFIVTYNRKKKIKFYRAIAVLAVILLSAGAFYFNYINGYYEILNPSKYGKIVLNFNKSNMNADNLFIGIDGDYEKASLNNGFDLKNLFSGKGNTNRNTPAGFFKTYYLPVGQHEFSIVSGSYKNIKQYYVNSISTLRANNSKDQTITIPITDLKPKEVEVYFRFWNQLNPNELLFQFDSYPDESIKKYQDEEGNLKILTRYDAVSLKDYIFKMKSSNKMSTPFYSNQKYTFRVDNFEKDGIKYDSKRFDVRFSLDDRTVVVHVPLVPSPAEIDIESTEKNLPIFINGDSSGMIYENGNYLYKPYANIKYKSFNKKYTAVLKVPYGKYDIRIKKTGKSVMYQLNTGRVVSLTVTKQNGKYIY
jgi:serine/threonine protein kinase